MNKHQRRQRVFAHRARCPRTLHSAASARLLTAVAALRMDRARLPACCHSLHLYATSCVLTCCGSMLLAAPLCATSCLHLPRRVSFAPLRASAVPCIGLLCGAARHCLPYIAWDIAVTRKHSLHALPLATHARLSVPSGRRDAQRLVRLLFCITLHICRAIFVRAHIAHSFASRCASVRAQHIFHAAFAHAAA